MLSSNKLEAGEKIIHSQKGLPVGAVTAQYSNNGEAQRLANQQS